jgi:hypothetical protein
MQYLEDTITVDLRVRTYHPVLIDAGLASQTTPIPWLDDRQLRFRFHPAKPQQDFFTENRG